MVTHEVRRRNQPIYFIHDDLDATQSCVITSKPSKPEQAPAQPSWTQAKLQMIFQSSRSFLLAIIVFILIAVCASAAAAQTVDFTDGESDPVKLFERAQNAHAKGDLERALALYEAAIKLRPEFPEAEFQRGVALAALKRPAEAEIALRRAIELRKDWTLPYSALGNLLSRSEKTRKPNRCCGARCSWARRISPLSIRFRRFAGEPAISRKRSPSPSARPKTKVRRLPHGSGAES